MRDRVRKLNDAPFRPQARYVLYWAQMNRRTEYNHALAHAIELANERSLPVLFYEGLTCAYPYASDRLHVFILEGVADTAAALKKQGVGYVFYPRRRRSDPDDILYRLAREAAAVVTDDYPTFIARQHNQRVPARLDIPYFVVDSSCIVPMSHMTRREYAAYTIRPKIHKALPHHLRPFEAPRVSRRYEDPPPPYHVESPDPPRLAAECEIDHTVKPTITHRGGARAAHRALTRFITRNLRRYARERNEPSAHATSGLSPHLHFGCISALEVALAARDHAAQHGLIADEFLEELIVRRELAFNHARFSEDPTSLESAPAWALETMRRHAGDPRPYRYNREQFESAATHDELWNAAQKELLLRGTIHGYYRMYWGKKIIEWSTSYQDALDDMIYLHDRYSLDGRDPNTYTNILWCFGLHDRPWVERPVFGQLRYMSHDGMKRKTNTQAYLREIESLERTGVDPFRVE